MNPLIPGLEEALRLLALNDLDFGPGRILKRIEQLKSEQPSGAMLIAMMPKITDPVLLDALEECGQRNPPPDTTEQLEQRVMELEAELKDTAQAHGRALVDATTAQAKLAEREDQLRQVEARLKELECWDLIEEFGTDDPAAILKQFHDCFDKLEQVEAQCAAMREALVSINNLECELEHSDECVCCLSDSPAKVIAEEALSTDCGKSILERLEEARWLLQPVIVGTCWNIGSSTREEWTQRRDSWLSDHTPTGGEK